MRRVTDWMRQAEGDLAAAADLLATGHYAWACFTAQQAAEKALKAFLESHARPSFGHNLLLLADEIEQDHPLPPEIRQVCAELNRHYIPTRYPDSFPAGAPVDMFTQRDGELAVNQARQVVQYVRAFV